MKSISNEEIARNIAYNLGNRVCDNIKTYGYEDVYNAALQAMQWKDEQFEKEKKQWIEKACEWLRHNMIGWDLGKYPEYAPGFIDDFQKAIEQ